MNAASTIAERLLAHLGLDREAPSLEYLDRIIDRHQRRVPFETLTKLVDYESGLARGDFLPPIEEYVERVIERGAGGLCWTLARGLHFLLDELGFRASLMYMDPGHCCVRVELPEGSFYADVGYSAPLFRAYPLFTSFTLETAAERFEYEVGEEGIQVTRHPGPAKRLDPTPRSLESLQPNIARANDWGVERSFLRILAVSRYVDGVYTSLRDGLYRRFTSSGIEERQVGGDEVRSLVENVFGIDPALFDAALAVRARYADSVADLGGEQSSRTSKSPDGADDG